MVFVPSNLTYHGLMNTIEDIVRIDSSTFNIELRVVMITSGRREIPRIKNDRDVAFLMFEERVIPEVYVTTVGSDSVFGLDGDGDSESDSDSHSGDIDGECESGYDLDCIGDSGWDLDGDGDSDGDNGSYVDGDIDCGCELDVYSDGYGHDRGGSFTSPLPWIIPGAENYSIQTINNDESSISNGHFYKGATKLCEGEYWQKERFQGILFVAVCKDANEQVYKIAFGIGQKESRKSWSWFLKQLRNYIRCPESCIFISDQHKRIAKAMEIVYSNAPRDLCGIHMVMNIKNRFKREDVTGNS
ncbi:hypothetical protein Ddye_013547 [Dipteronia dyeriana]|uniref:MULE transposase domain-containing protein n=1 Tax=Dipteronia dyeriana TaxID=168575 RepID=A0AAD9X6L3_9ROSI|nr:hypothetical protein Ddye_013547 [Dipteronia dyeriana]